jgi:hypothetical protein
VRGRIPGEGGRTSGLFGKALRAADAVADPDTAALLLRPFRIESLTDAQAESFARIAGGHGQRWTAGLLRTWFGGDQPAWAYGGGQARPQWVADSLPALCEGLHATGSVGTLAAQQLVDLAWEWLGQDIGAGLTSSSPSRREEKLACLGKPLASVLTAAAVIGAAGTRDMVTGYMRKQGDAVTALEMSALRVAAELPGHGTRSKAGFGDLAADCAPRLRTRLDRPRRAPGNWSIELPAGGWRAPGGSGVGADTGAGDHIPPFGRGVVRSWPPASRPARVLAARAAAISPIGPSGSTTARSAPTSGSFFMGCRSRGRRASPPTCSMTRKTPKQSHRSLSTLSDPLMTTRARSRTPLHRTLSVSRSGEGMV